MKINHCNWKADLFIWLEISAKKYCLATLSYQPMEMIFDSKLLQIRVWVTKYYIPNIIEILNHLCSSNISHWTIQTKPNYFQINFGTMGWFRLAKKLCKNVQCTLTHLYIWHVYKTPLLSIVPHCIVFLKSIFE